MNWYSFGERILMIIISLMCQGDGWFTAWLDAAELDTTHWLHLCNSGLARCLATGERAKFKREAVNAANLYLFVLFVCWFSRNEPIVRAKQLLPSGIELTRYVSSSKCVGWLLRIQERMMSHDKHKKLCHHSHNAAQTTRWPCEVTHKQRLRTLFA